MATLVVGLLAGASLGPALYILIVYLEPQGDALLTIALSVLATFAFCLVLATIAAYFILPRLFANAHGTLSAVAEDLARASQAHAQGKSDAALVHLGRAAHEGVAWYSVGATRRFVVQAALGLLISFGGIVGSVLLLSQNAKIDKQLVLLTQQNEKIDQQTAVADAQKRGAFVTELFSIVQDVTKEFAKNSLVNGELPKELVTRIAVLTSSAVPYRYLDQRDDRRRSIRVALSPERGQLVVALARMKIRMSSLSGAGADFSRSDLRGFDLRGADLSEVGLTGSDFSHSDLTRARFVGAYLNNAVFNKVDARRANFAAAELYGANFESSDLSDATFDDATLSRVLILDSDLSNSSFARAAGSTLTFAGVKLSREADELPAGIPWSSKIRKDFAVWREGSSKAGFRFSFVVPAPKPIPNGP